MALTAKDRVLLQRCLRHEPGAWNDFVDRFLGLIYHVVHHTAHLRSVPLRGEDIEDVAAEVFLQVIAKDYMVLRQFRGRSSLATYLAVIARRACVHELNRRSEGAEIETRIADGRQRPDITRGQTAEAGGETENQEEVQKLLRKLPTGEREVVRLFYLEGRTYEEISSLLHLPVNSIGPILSRARLKLRKGVKNPPPIHRETNPKTPSQNNP